MKLSELYGVLEKFAPKSLSEEYCRKYDAYDNSGILVDCGEEVKKVLFSLDFSEKVLDEAEETGVNVLVTHHPAIYSKISDICFSDPQGEKLQRAIKGGISVISMHLNFDCAENGIDEELMRGIGGTEATICEPLQTPGTGYGRIYDVAPVTAEELCERIKKNFRTSRIWCYGKDETVTRAASFCGAGATEEAVRQAVKGKADCIISADFKHHVVAMALEYGLSVIQLTHYASENYGFNKIYLRLKEQLGTESDYFADPELL